MKNLYTAVLCLCSTLSLLESAAQPLNEPDLNRPKLFRQLPDTILVDINKLTNLFNKTEGESVSVELSDVVSFSFQGQVVSTIIKYGNSIRSIVIRSTNYQGASLSFTRVTKDDGTVAYNGRIMSFQHGDLFELVEKDNRFILKKRGFYDIVNE